MSKLKTILLPASLILAAGFLIGVYTGFHVNTGLGGIPEYEWYGFPWFWVISVNHGTRYIFWWSNLVVDTVFWTIPMALLYFTFKIKERVALAPFWGLYLTLFSGLILQKYQFDTHLAGDSFLYGYPLSWRNVIHSAFYQTPLHQVIWLNFIADMAFWSILPLAAIMSIGKVSRRVKENLRKKPLPVFGSRESTHVPVNHERPFVVVPAIFLEAITSAIFMIFLYSAASSVYNNFIGSNGYPVWVYNVSGFWFRDVLVYFSGDNFGGNIYNQYFFFYELITLYLIESVLPLILAMGLARESRAALLGGIIFSLWCALQFGLDHPLNANGALVSSVLLVVLVASESWSRLGEKKSRPCRWIEKVQERPEVAKTNKS